MLPALFMEIKATDLILDMCAAPGSKTGQIIEILQKSGSLFDVTGGVIANEVDAKRARVLAHQLLRLNFPGFAVVNHPGQFLPCPTSTPFNKVLVDVPCTGDGAIRKLPQKWKNWSPEDSHGLHRLQIQLLDRAVGLIKEGGLIVYSTCSLNPIENEAVVAEVIRKYNSRLSGYLELVDVHQQFPDFKMTKGIKDWGVFKLSEKKESGDTPTFEPIPKGSSTKVPGKFTRQRLSDKVHRHRSEY